MRIRNLSLAVVMAGLTFGGTFTCTSNDDDDDDFHVSSSNSGNGNGGGGVQSGDSVTPIGSSSSESVATTL